MEMCLKHNSLDPTQDLPKTKPEVFLLGDSDKETLNYARFKVLFIAWDTNPRYSHGLFLGIYVL